MKNFFLVLTISFILSIATACNNAMDDQVNDNISADYTTISSNQYPHTKAIVVQKAKYEFVEVEGGEFKAQQIPLTQRNEMQQQGQGNAERKQATPAPQQQATPQKQDQQQATPQQQEQEPAQNQQAAPEQQQQAQGEQEQAEPNAQTTEGLSDFESKVVELTNVQRRNNGLPDLKAHTKLSGVAREKSNDMRKNNYFSHTSPTYGSPFDMMRDFGVSYKSAGENIAQGQPSPQEVVDAWMNSEGHRKNILSGDFTHIGVGHDENGHYWTQMFIRQ